MHVGNCDSLLEGGPTLRDWLKKMLGPASRPVGEAGGTLTDFELQTPMPNLSAWRRWLEENRWATAPHYVAAMVDSIARFGLFDPVHGFALPGEITIDPGNLRESVLFRGINGRCRAVLKLLAEAPLRRDAIVYAAESLTPLAAALRIQFPNFIGSEYLPTDSEQRRFPQTKHEDVEALSFRDSSLDCYVSCEILEHVPSIPRALREAARTLRHGGLFVATFPFLQLQQESVVKAVLENGSIRHLTTPEYHGNPIDPRRSLVFSIPAWDIVDTAKDAGFTAVDMVAMSSRKFGIVADCPILVMQARR
jgi:SAM-dependent methyltransferase